MITLRGKLTKTLVQAKPVTPAITRSNLGPSDVNASSAPQAENAAPAVDAIPQVPPGNGARPEIDVNVSHNQKDPTPTTSGDNANPPSVEAPSQDTPIIQQPLVEEWIWRGVWAFGSLPEDKDDVLLPSSGNESKTPPLEGHKVDESKLENIKGDGVKGDDKGEPKVNDDKKEGEAPLNESSQALMNNTTKPRPFFYRFIKVVDAKDVIVPSSLLVQEIVEEGEKDVRGGGGEMKIGVEGGEKKDDGAAAAAEISEVKNKAVAVSATTAAVASEVKLDVKLADATGVVYDDTKVDAATATSKDGEKIGLPTTNQTIDQVSTNKDVFDIPSQDAAQIADAKPNEGADAVMSDPTKISVTQESNDNKTAEPPTAMAESSTQKATESTAVLPSQTTKQASASTKQTYGDEPYTPASLTHPTPPGGKWEGHFENIVPNNPSYTRNSNSGRRKDKKDNRIREVFYLFFNSTPEKDAKTAFEEDTVVDINNDIKVGEEGDKKDGQEGDARGEEVESTALLLPEGRIHVRGYGTNRFGTFEIVGSLDCESGMLHVQRMYVETPPEKESKRPKREGGTGRRGRPPKNKDREGGMINDSNKQRGRKRKPSLKKRTMEFLDDGTAIDMGGMDIASAVKKRARLSVDSSTGSAQIGFPLPQCREDVRPSSGSKQQHQQLVPSLKGSGGNMGSSKKKNPAPQNREASLMSQFVQPIVDVMDPLPSDGDPLLARWRAAHYLYYQREEANNEDGGDGANNAASKVNSVVYEGEMVDGYREGMGICLYDNNTMYEGKWKKNKEHGKGTLMTPDRSKIIYEGDWERGRMHGSGSYFYYKDIFFGGVGQYVGDFRENLRHGRGKYTFPDGSTYEGEWKENAPNGWGLFRWTDGSLYEGFWSKGCRHGNIGTLIVSDGFRYEGAWVDNAMEGRGVATYPNGQVYEGMWVAGRREGRGTIRFTNGAIYEGRFKDDNMEGQGTMKMSRNAIIPLHSNDDDSDDEIMQRDDGEPKNDWMIPIEFQSDISHIHQKAGFSQVGL